MALLSVPLGLLWLLFINVAGYFLPTKLFATENAMRAADFVVWLGFFAVGYLQWFKLVPWLILNGVRNRRERET